MKRTLSRILLAPLALGVLGAGLGAAAASAAEPAADCARVETAALNPLCNTGGGLRVRVVIGDAVAIGTTDAIAATATCPSRYRLVGGGFRIEGVGAEEPVVRASYPDDVDWRVVVAPVDVAGPTVTAYALCARR
ncbi:hypothetical protein [Actinocorallia sp. A-T 12471]|uniref:hypothetical protein n=1 Tax=Actinocorallia sp. A-T 12471 TaxID=3089813 RepID=UPI0029CB89E2|nr:hypothetical protein [Actinocorallia sp. A-T 12471]MDX6742841.1 hypothetical protein [Actinocorallia sp. A-T 12471]